MAYASALLPEDREWLESEVDDLIAGQRSVRNAEIMQEIVDRLDMMASQGNEDASRAIKSLAADGVRSLVERCVKKQHGAVKISGTGRIVSIPARVGARARDEVGTLLKVYQQTLWYEMSWDDFVAMIASRLQHIAELEDKVAAFQEIVKYRDMYPETQTPGEALRQAGIDPQSVNLDLTA